MASKIIGRRPCPWCGFAHMHVKESEKCLYAYCPECGTNGPHARTALQRANMVKGMRQEGGQAEPTPTPTPTEKPAPAPKAAAPAPAPTPTPTPAAKRRGLFAFGG